MNDATEYRGIIIEKIIEHASYGDQARSCMLVLYLLDSAAHNSPLLSN